MRKYVFIDVETTGVNPEKNGIHQISGAIRIGDKTVDTFDYRVKPKEGCVIGNGALEVSGVSLEEIRKYTPMKDVYRQLTAKLKQYVNKFDKNDKFFFVAYNAHFDNNFMRQWFADNGDKYFGSWFWSGSLDVMVFASAFFSNVRAKLNSMKLENVAAILGVPLEKAHDAMEDIKATMNVADLIAPEVFLEKPREIKPQMFLDKQIPKEPYKEMSDESYIFHSGDEREATAYNNTNYPGLTHEQIMERQEDCYDNPKG